MTQQVLFWWGFPLTISVLGIAWLVYDHYNHPERRD